MDLPTDVAMVMVPAGRTGRTKSTYSTWKKMQRLEDGEHCGIERINDLVALRVVLSPENKAVDGIDDVQRLVGRWTSSAAPVNGSSSSAALSSLLSASSSLPPLLEGACAAQAAVARRGGGLCSGAVGGETPLVRHRKYKSRMLRL